MVGANFKIQNGLPFCQNADPGFWLSGADFDEIRFMSGFERDEQPATLLQSIAVLPSCVSVSQSVSQRAKIRILS